MNTQKIKKVSTPKVALERIGFLGLGIMGSAMAENLIRAGFQVSGFDPSAKARQQLKAAGGKPCRDAAELVGSVQVVISSLPNAAALKDSAEVLATAGQKGLLVIETSTLDPRDKEAARAKVAKSGVVLLDCPLSGTGAQAKRKDLTVYASGSKADIRRLVPVFEGFSKAHFDLGAFGNGMKMKLMANLLVAIHNVSTAEALLLGQRWGISPRKAVEVLSDGAGGSRMLQVRGPFMEDEGWKEVTMKISVWQKDMYLISQALAETQVAAPLFAATVPIYNAAMGMGHASHDTAAVFDVLSRMCSEPTKSASKKGDLMKLSLNHFSIRTLDLAATKNFYVSLLGLTDGPRPEFPFPGHWLYQGPTDVYSNAAVHIIGIDRNDASGLKNYLGDRADSQLTGSGALDHVAFFATDLAGMLERLSENGIEPRRRDVPGLGLHQLFLDDPNGIVVELNYSFAEKQALDALATGA